MKKLSRKSLKLAKLISVALISTFVLGLGAKVYAEYTSTTPGGGNADDDAVETGLCSGAYVGKLCYNSYNPNASGWKWVYVPFNGRTKVRYSDINAFNNHGAVTGTSGNTYADLPGCVEAGAEGFYVLGTFWYEMAKNSSGNFYAAQHTNGSGKHEIIGPFIWNTVWGSWNGSGPSNGESNINDSWAGGEHTVSWTQVQTAYEMGRSAGSEMKGYFNVGAYSTVCAWETAGGIQSNTHAWIAENNELADADWKDNQTDDDAVYNVTLGKLTNDFCKNKKTDTREDKEVEVHLASYLRAKNATAAKPAKTNFRIRHTVSGSGVTVTGENWQPAYGPQDYEIKDENEHHLPNELGYNKIFKVKIPKNTPGGTKVRICEFIDYKKKETDADYTGTTHACATINVITEEETVPPCPNREICEEINGIDMGGPNYGNTMADVYVRNLSSKDSMRQLIKDNNRLDDDGFLDTWIFAKPGDSVQFRHRLCSAAMEVSGSSLYEDKDDDDGVGKWSGGNAYAFGLPSHDYSAVNYKFAIEAKPNRSYAFGNSILDSWVNDGPPGNWVNVNGGPASGAQYTPKSPESPVYSLPDKDRNEIGFRIYSPSVDANEKYRCSPQYTTSRNGWTSPGYQIPAFTTWPTLSSACGAVSNTTGAENTYMIGVGKTITQKIYWNNIVGFEQLRGTDAIYGRCGNSCGDTTDTRYNISWNHRTNKKNNPHAYRYGEYDAVKAAGGAWYWRQSYCTTSCCSGCCNKCSPVYRTNNGDAWYKPVYWYDHTKYQGKQYEEDDATIYTPFNFTTDKTISITNNPVVYGGSSVSSNWKYEILPKQNVFTADFQYATITPKSSKMQVVEFLLDPEKGGIDPGDDNVDVADVCTYYKDRGATECAVIQEDPGPFNPTGDYEGWNRSGSRTRTVPDVEAGTKYCVAIGVYPADSTNRKDITPDQDGIDLLKDLGMKGGDTWNISNAVCRTIAKKPTFQLWNGGLWIPSSVITSVSKKEVGASLGHDYDEASTKIFGSWSEQTLVATGSVWGMSSGAGLGYNGTSGLGGKNEYNFALRGGVSHGATHAQVSNLTISNTGSDMGNSGITALSSSILTRLKARYKNLAASSVDTYDGVNGNGLRYRRYSGSVNIGSIVKDADESGRDNTLVIQVDGTAIIDHNICYGSCPNGPYTVEFSGGKKVNGGGTKLENYSMRAKSIAALPQILIFANDIMIAESVTRVDAWLIADEGSIDTCYDGAAENSRVCQDPLVVNGPVFAQSLTLNRTAGNWPGGGTHESGNVQKQNLANDGSITPGEIFNLRSDVYLWAYNQAQNFTEAVVTYMRELAPRY